MSASEKTIGKPPSKNYIRILWNRLKEHPLSRLGPGLITGVADDDPSGIATYSQANLGWITTAVMGIAAVWMFVPNS